MKSIKGYILEFLPTSNPRTLAAKQHSAGNSAPKITVTELEITFDGITIHLSVPLFYPNPLSLLCPT